MRRARWLLCVAAAIALPAAVRAQDSVRFDALLGLARVERDAGRPARAIDYFRQADEVRPLDAALTEEYFWTAAETDLRLADELGRRVLASVPTREGVRDRLVEIAARAFDEARVVELAGEGARINPRRALWHRRLGESYLRQGRPAEAAAAFARTAGLPDAQTEDIAQAALALEASGSIRAAYDAWRRIGDDVWRSRPDWTASRLRATAAYEPPDTAAPQLAEHLAAHPDDEDARALLVEVYARANQPARALETLAPLLTGPSRGRWVRREADLAVAAGDLERALRALDNVERRAGPCGTARLEVLDRLENPARLIAAVQARPLTCPRQAAWLDRAIERAIAAGLHGPALSMIENRLSGGEASILDHELHGQLLLWIGEPARAIPVLESVLAVDPERLAAAEALVDAFRATNRPTDAWLALDRHLGDEIAGHPRRLEWAQLALDARHATEALQIAHAVPPATDSDERRVRGIRGQALAQLGRYAEARAVLAPIADFAQPGEALALLDSIEATSGPEDALRAGAIWRSASGPGWSGIVARLDAIDAELRTRAFERQVTDLAARGEVEDVLALLDSRPSDRRLEELRAAVRPSLVRASVERIDALRRTGSTTDVVLALERFDAEFGDDTEARIEIADRLAGYALTADDALVSRLAEWIDRVDAADPLALDARLAKARLYAATRAWDNALIVIDAALTTSPGLPAALELRAELLSYAGEYAASVAAYDTYLRVAPDDVAARRQQARVEGWRQAYGAAEDRYRTLVQLFPNVPVLRAEAEAKTAFYKERWRRAAGAYRDWLSIEPDDTEARFELAQTYQHLGDAAAADREYAVLLADVPPHRQALDASWRLRDGRALRPAFSASTQSAAGYGGRRLLDETTSLAQITRGAGRGRWLVAAGPSRVSDADLTSLGWRANARIDGVGSESWRLDAGLSAHAYSTLGTAFAGGDASLNWLPADGFRLQGGVARTPLLDNLGTLRQEIAVNGPAASLFYRPTAGLFLDLRASAGELTDGNGRREARAAISQRVLGGRNDLRLVADAQTLAFREERADYFSPSEFWQANAGVTYRRWIDTPRYAGDRERWLEGSYLAGVDNRDVVYHAGRAGFAFEFDSGLSVGASAAVTRSDVYNSTAVMLTLRLNPFTRAR
jgi:tetratricopeptide (TPR) repeat protein